MLKYKIDVLQALKDAGYSSYRRRNDKIMGQAEEQKIRGGGLPSWATLNKICSLLHCQPGDIIEYADE